MNNLIPAFLGKHKIIGIGGADFRVQRFGDA